MRADVRGACPVMSFRLKPHESVAKGVRRVLLSQIDSARTRLGDKPVAEPLAIHEARKSLKRIRSTLRLVRSGIGEKAFERENAAFREIAALLAGERDRHVLLETVTALRAKDQPDDVASALAHLAGRLQANSDKSEAPAGAPPAIQARLVKARKALDSARKRIRRLDMVPDGFAPLERGPRRTQRDTIRTLEHAWHLQTDEAFHDWRKNVQRHWRHMKLLAAAWPELLEARAATARELSQLLGDDHDLSMLIAFAANRSRSGLTARQVRALSGVLRQEQAALRDRARTIGLRLTADKPKSLSRHIALLWSLAASAASQPAASEAEDAASD